MCKVKYYIGTMSTIHHHNGILFYLMAQNEHFQYHLPVIMRADI